MFLWFGVCACSFSTQFKRLSMHPGLHYNPSMPSWICPSIQPLNQPWSFDDHLFIRHVFLHASSHASMRVSSHPSTHCKIIHPIYLYMHLYIYIYIAIDIYTYIYIYVYIYVPLMLSCVSISRSWAAMRVNRVQIEFCISRVKLGLGTNLKHLEYFLTYTS